MSSAEVRIDAAPSLAVRVSIKVFASAVPVVIPALSLRSLLFASCGEDRKVENGQNRPPAQGGERFSAVFGARLACLFSGIGCYCITTRPDRLRDAKPVWAQTPKIRERL